MSQAQAERDALYSKIADLEKVVCKSLLMYNIILLEEKKYLYVYLHTYTCLPVPNHSLITDHW